MLITGSSLPSACGDRAGRSDPQRFRCTAGVHPHHAAELDESALQELATLAAAPEVVAVGECGLDYFRNLSPRPAQLIAFGRQLDLAVQLRKPVFLHQRDAHDDFLRILREYGSRLVGGVAHCFTAGTAEARAYLDLGLYWHHRLDLGRAADYLREVVRFGRAAAARTDGRTVAARPGRSRRAAQQPMYLPHVLRASLRPRRRRNRVADDA
jgi:TatD DNase family protein